MPSTRRTTALAVALLTALPLGMLIAVPAPAGAVGDVGLLDPTFSPDAPAGVTASFTDRQLVGLAAQQDGKVVAVSDQGSDFWITRFNADGSVDTGFGIAGTGIATVDVGGAGQTDHAQAVAIDAANRIVVAGSGGAAAADFALVRLDPNGKALQINSHVHIGNDADPSLASDLAFQSDGTIVVAGTAEVGTDSDFAIARFNTATGAIVGGPVVATLGTGDEIGRAVAVYPSGPNKDKIVVVGDTGTAGNTAIGVVQWNANGAEDGAFNGSGQRIIDPTVGSDSASGVAITAAGSILIAGINGAADRDLVLTQLLPSGGNDGAFNLGSVRTLTKSGSEIVRNHPLALQADGKIVVAADSNDGQDAGVFRLNADGSADASFGTTGDGTFNGSGNDDANAVALDPAGRILVAGDDAASSGYVARLIGVPDSDADGLRDNADGCPAVAGPVANHGCPYEATVHGKKVVLDTIVSKKKASAKCPAKAKVVVTTKTKHGRAKVVKRLKTTPVATGCQVKGKVRLPAKPTAKARTKVAISGKQLTKKQLIAVRL